MIIRAAHPSEFGWIVERTGLELTAGMKAIAAVDASGRILGMIAGTGWTPNAVAVHVASDSPLAARALLRAAATWIFDQAGRSVALGVIKADNARSLRIAKAAGFREVYRVRNGWESGVDLVALELRREWCRWPARKVKVAA